MQNGKSNRLQDLFLHVYHFRWRKFLGRDESVISRIVLPVVFLGPLLELVCNLHAGSSDQLQSCLGLRFTDRGHEQVEQVDTHVKSLRLEVKVLRHVNQPVDEDLAHSQGDL